MHAGPTNHGIGVRLPCIEKTSGRLSILDEIHMFKDKMKSSVRDRVEKKLPQLVCIYIYSGAYGEKLLMTLLQAKHCKFTVWKTYLRLKFVETSKNKLKNRSAKNAVENSPQKTDLVTKMATELHERHFISDFHRFNLFEFGIHTFV